MSATSVAQPTRWARPLFALLGVALGIALIVGTVLSVTRLRHPSDACQERPVPIEAIMTGAGEATQIRGAIELLPFGLTCEYIDPRNPEETVTVADSIWPTVTLYGGVALVLGSALMVATGRRTHTRA